MQKLEQLYEGKAKKVYKTDHPEQLIVSYKDVVSAGDGARHGVIQDKGAVNNRVTNHIMGRLAQDGIPTHFIEELNDNETLVKKVDIVPLEVIARNIVAGSLSQRLGVEEGHILASPVLEYCYKDDALGDPLVNDYHIRAMGWATAEELDTIADYALQINGLLKGYMTDAGITLVDFKIEFGRLPDGTIILADEISPDTCRFWDSETGAKMDKDLFRRDLGGEEEGYKEVMRRLLGEDVDA